MGYNILNLRLIANTLTTCTLVLLLAGCQSLEVDSTVPTGSDTIRSSGDINVGVTPLPRAEMALPRKRCSPEVFSYLEDKSIDEVSVDDIEDHQSVGRVRILSLGQSATMDYRMDRLNLSLDEENRIRRVTCG